jgi:hypothetical protein
MRASLVAVLLAASSLAAADPAPRRATAVPTRVMACAPDPVHLAAHGDDPLLCWDAGCMKLAVSDDAATFEPAAPTEPRWPVPSGEVRLDGGKLAACAGGACTPLGKRLVAAIDAARASATADEPVTLAATTNRKAVVVNRVAWSVAADRPLTPHAPGTKAEGLTLYGAEVVGDRLVMSWSNCAGPCTQATLDDATGAARSRLFEGGGAVFMLDATRFVVVSEYGELHAFDLATGAARGELHLETNDPSASALRVGERLYVLYRTLHGVHVMDIDASEPGALRKGLVMDLPSCGD